MCLYNNGRNDISVCSVILFYWNENNSFASTLKFVIRTCRQIDGIAPTFAKKPAIRQEDDGKRLLFECRITADPTPKVTWFHDGNMVKDSPRHKVGYLYLSIYPLFTGGKKSREIAGGIWLVNFKEGNAYFHTHSCFYHSICTHILIQTTIHIWTSMH